VALLALLAAGAAGAEESVAKLTAYSGVLSVIRGGAGLGLHPELGLLNGDVVSTRDGRATIVFNDRSEVRVRPNTRLAINDTPERRDIDVFFGRLWAFVSSRRDKQTNFKTGGTIAAVRGTVLEYLAEAAPWLTQQQLEDLTLLKIVRVSVGVASGSVEILHQLPDGSLKTLVINAGELGSIDPDNDKTYVGTFSEGDIAGDEGDEGGDDGTGDKPKDKDDPPTATCTGCQIADPVTNRCIDYDALCSDPCFRDQRCVAGQCIGGRRVVSSEDPNCP
jgi:hypothetical protein